MSDKQIVVLVIVVIFVIYAVWKFSTPDHENGDDDRVIMKNPECDDDRFNQVRVFIEGNIKEVYISLFDIRNVTFCHPSHDSNYAINKEANRLVITGDPNLIIELRNGHKLNVSPFADWDRHNLMQLCD